MLYPEGQYIPNTIAKRIVLARAIVNDPKLLLLKDPLENFEEQDAQRIMDYLADENQPWTLIVSSKNKLWKQFCPDRVKLENQTLTK